MLSASSMETGSALAGSASQLLPASGGRNAGLDLARAAAITLVFMSHTLVAFVPPVAGVALQWGGKAGVELFFSLSGFLIGSILIRMSKARLGLRVVAEFLFRRWMRTLPAYFVALGFMSWFFGRMPVHEWLLLQNFYPAEPRFLVVSWSLVLEEYFYFFFPLAMLLLAGIAGRGARLVAVVAVGPIIICGAVGLAAAYGLFVPQPGFLQENPFARMDCAAYGVVAAALLHGQAGAVAWLRQRARIVVAAALLAAVLWMLLFLAVSCLPGVTLLEWGFGHWGKPYLAIQTRVQDAVFAILVLALYLGPPRLPAWIAAGVLRISLWSYSIYLLHVIVMTLLHYYVPALSNNGAGLAVVLVLTLLVSAGSYHLIERPALWLRDWVIPGSASRLA